MPEKECYACGHIIKTPNRVCFICQREEGKIYERWAGNKETLYMVAEYKNLVRSTISKHICNFCYDWVRTSFVRMRHQVNPPKRNRKPKET